MIFCSLFNTLLLHVINLLYPSCWLWYWVIKYENPIKCSCPSLSLVLHWQAQVEVCELQEQGTLYSGLNACVSILAAQTYYNYRILHELSFNIWNTYMTRVRCFLSCDFSPHRPATGYIFHGFLAFRITGCIRRVYYKDI